MLKITAMSLALLLGLIVLVVVIGYVLPKQHVAARAISLRQKPADVFALISNFKLNCYLTVMGTRVFGNTARMAFSRWRSSSRIRRSGW
jgi:hypothetical protein